MTALGRGTQSHLPVTFSTAFRRPEQWFCETIKNFLVILLCKIISFLDSSFLEDKEEPSSGFVEQLRISLSYRFALQIHLSGFQFSGMSFEAVSIPRKAFVPSNDFLTFDTCSHLQFFHREAHGYGIFTV